MVETPDGLGRRRRRRVETRRIARTDPKYVRDCHFGNWSLTTWKKDKSPLPDGSRYRLTPYRCRSWRHAGACRNQRAADDVTRIKQAIAADDPRAFVYVVLTFDQRRRAAAGDGLFDAYRALLGCWAKLRKRIAREWGRFQFVAVVEQHQSGWPHLNVLIKSARLAEECRTETTVTRKGNVYTVTGWQRLRSRWLRGHAVASGFGPISYLEPMRDADAMAGYLVKLAGQLVGEQAKGSQVPVHAPRHFRRLRSSRGFLPPLSKDETLTGCLTFAPVEEVATWGAPFVPVEVRTPVDVDTQARPVIVIEYEWDVIPWDAHEMREAPRTAEERTAIKRIKKEAHMIYGRHDG